VAKDVEEGISQISMFELSRIRDGSRLSSSSGKLVTISSTDRQAKKDKTGNGTGLMGLG
jgi:hypothetical protein